MKIDPKPKPGLKRRATILRNNGDGTVLIGLDQVELQGDQQKINVPMPLSWSGPGGQFAGGAAVVGSTVTVSQAQGGKWYIENYVPSQNALSGKNLLSTLRPDRYLIQAKNGTRLFVEPNGVQAGDSVNFIHIDPENDIISHNFFTEMSFTESSRSIKGIIKRDLVENSNRNVLGSTLTSHLYDESLFSVSLDPSAQNSFQTIAGRVRNPPLVENREVVYEFANSFNVLADIDESKRIENEQAIPRQADFGRRDNRTDALSLGLSFPNHLIETIKGTAVDLYGNVLDINRNPLPIGSSDKLSLLKNPNKAEAYAKIRAQMRKSIAYHFEINTRKPGDSDEITSIPNVDDTSDYARKRSRFFIDIDKEGQFKINIPASSETGNIPLPTRYENFSVLLAKKDASNDPNQFIRNEDSREIFLEGIGGKSSIKLQNGDGSEGSASPIDRITSLPINYGTVFHDITKSFSTFTQGRQQLVLFDDSHLLNSIKPYEKIISNTINVSGTNANAGGRSGALFLDGFINVNVGANTIDRQSAWFDFAGGIVSQIGRDKRGISYAAKLDGDMILELGGTGIGNTYDSRFASENDAVRPAVFEMHVLKGDGLMTVIRVDSKGVSIATQGRLDISAQQDIILKSNSNLHFNAENVYFFSDTNQIRQVERKNVTI